MSDETRRGAEPEEDPNKIATGMTLADISIRNHVFAWILMFALIGFGILCFTGREMSLTVVAALLTLAGFSINDTIVVFDRIRERSKTLAKETHERAFDIAINETLSRTVITSLTVFLSSVALYFFGGEVINDFALAMVVGVAFGTYSSVYVASALALEMWNLSDRRRKPARARAA